MTDSIDYLGAFAYRVNPDVHAVAVDRLAGVLIARDAVAAARLADPGAFPNVWYDTCPHATTRRLIAELLDLGWAPPSAEDIATAVGRIGTDYYRTSGAAR